MTSIIITPEAADDIRRVHEWWVAHRPSAPGLFLEELAEASALLAKSPDAGRRYGIRGVPGVRRWLLRASRYHVYYAHDGANVHVLAIWSAVRGRGPRIKVP